jgi:carbon-monoxide dehydrogenase small subunit
MAVNIEDTEKHETTVTVNGEQYEREIEPRRLLSDFIRHDLGLTGTHVGCEHGACGMCTVLMDGRTIRSCLIFAVQADGATIETVESLGRRDDLHPIQEGFIEEHGLQCGFCTPAMLMTAKELLDEESNPDTEEVREAMSANLCRCTGYEMIVDSVETAAEKLQLEPERAGDSP